MKRIFLDLEMNPISKNHKEARKILLQEVIEFGAVMLDEHNHEIDHFAWYVRPEYNTEITEHIRKITGISTEKVADAETFERVFDEFVDWCGSDYKIYSWSDNDPIQLQKEMELKNIPVFPEASYMFMHWCDLQKQYDELLFCERQMSLKTAVDTAGLNFRGRAHSALVDATATADIYREMKEGKALKKINDMLAEARKPAGTCLGDLLSGIVIQPA